VAVGRQDKIMTAVVAALVILVAALAVFARLF
jgi:hypothetical protein